MSKRRRHSRSRVPAASRVARPASFSAPDIRPYRDPTSSLLAWDGFANPVSFLGESSALFSAGTFVRSGLTQDPEKLTTLYRESWLAKKIIDMPAEDMTRAWYTLSADLPEEDMDALKNLEARHAIRNEITNAIRWARLYGGSIALMVIRGDEDKLSRPLDPDLLYPGCFQGLLVLDRFQSVEPSMELVEDLDDPDFGLPAYYDISVDMGEMSSLRVHHSRVLRFAGRELPAMEAQRENYWGASELEHIWEEIQKRSNTSANIAQLVFQANVTTLKMSDFGETLAYGTESQQRRLLQSVEEQNRLRTSFGLQLLSRDDSFENHPYSFSGLSDIYSEFMMDMAGAAEIPATRLFGRSPQGLNATGESDLINYYERISQLQETYLRPALERLLPVMEISAFGYDAPDARIVFEPIAATTPAARADIMQKISATMISLYQSGLISAEAALEELRAQGRELGVFSNLTLPAAPAPEALPAAATGSGLPASEKKEHVIPGELN